MSFEQMEFPFVGDLAEKRARSSPSRPMPAMPAAAVSCAGMTRCLNTFGRRRLSATASRLRRCAGTSSQFPCVIRAAFIAPCAFDRMRRTVAISATEISVSTKRRVFGIIHPVRSTGFRDCAGRARDAEGSQRQRFAASTQRREA